MAVTLPTNASEVVNRQKADVQNALPSSNPFLKNGLLTALVQSSGYRFYDLYQLVNVLQSGLFLDNYADFSVLDFWGGLVDLTLGKPTASSGKVVFSGNTNGILIPSGEILSNGSLTYKTLVDGTLSQNSNTILQITQSSGIATIVFSGDHGLATGINITISGADQVNYNGVKTVTVINNTEVTFDIDETTTSPATGSLTSTYYVASVEVQSNDNGANTNLSSGAALSLQNTITNINNNAYVSLNGLTGGTDTETEDNYKARIVDAWQNPVTNFNAASIINQAKKVDDITRVFVLRATNGVSGGSYLKDAAGFVTIYCVKDNSDTIITNSTDNSLVKTAILSIAPMNDVSDNINVLSLTPIPIDFTFTSISPDTTTMRTAIQENIQQFFKSKNSINGVETGEEDRGTMKINDINLAILQTVDNITGQSLESYVLSTPISDVSVNDGEIVVVGNINFT